MIIKCENLSYKYDSTNGISDISTEFKSGNVYGLIGPSGAGKSTLIKLISGNIKPKTGNIKIDDKEIDKGLIKDINQTLNMYTGVLESSFVLENEKVRAIGEIGFDYHYDSPGRDCQKKWFVRQIELATDNTAKTVGFYKSMGFAEMSEIGCCGFMKC